MNDNITADPAIHEELHTASLEELEQIDFGSIGQEERLKALGEEQIAAIEEKLAAAKRRYENGTAYLTTCLARFFDTVPHKKTKTTEKYRLLSGTLTLKKGGIKAEADDETLVPWLKANGMGDFVKVKEAAAWSDLKKKLTFVGGVATIEETGEIVEGITVTEAPDAFKVEI